MPKNISSIKDQRERKDQPRHKKPIEFLVDDIPFEFLDGEEESRSVFVPKHVNAKGEKIILRRQENELIKKKTVIQPPILPWKILKNIIKKDYLKVPPPSLHQAEDLESGNLENYFQNLTKMNSGPYSISLNLGFHVLKKMKHIKTPFRNAFYLGSSNLFAALDSQAFHLWKSNSRVMTVPLVNESEEKPRNLKGITIWTYIDKYQIHVAAMKNLQIKVLDSHFNELSSVLTSKPVLCFEFSALKNELITGEVASIKIWKIKVQKFNSKISYFLEQRYEITDFSQGEWVTCLKYDWSFNRLFAGCDNSLRVYEYGSGNLFETVRDIHDLSLTCVEYYEPNDTIITAGKDGSIKIWSRNRMVYNFTEHFKSVTALALMEEGCHALPGSMPLLLSSSLDGSIRMWNFETGQSVHRHEYIFLMLGSTLGWKFFKSSFLTRIIFI